VSRSPTSTATKEGSGICEIEEKKPLLKEHHKIRKKLRRRRGRNASRCGFGNLLAECGEEREKLQGGVVLKGYANTLRKRLMQVMQKRPKKIVSTPGKAVRKEGSAARRRSTLTEGTGMVVS